MDTTATATTIPGARRSAGPTAGSTLAGAGTPDASADVMVSLTALDAGAAHKHGRQCFWNVEKCAWQCPPSVA